MRVFQPYDDVDLIVDAVEHHGFAAIEGTKSSAVPCCNKVLMALTDVSHISAVVSYQNVRHSGYFYLVVNTGVFALDDRELKRHVDDLDQIQSRHWDDH
jgi:hypothetical protein